jgi:dihydrofolate synthase/folylpolyglutamate synthase
LSKPGRFTYAEAISYLNKFIDFERLPEPRMATEAKDVERFRRLLSQLGDPHLTYPVIHIAGTKGKGSTAALIASILQAAGYKVGLYTSPHLVSVRERISVSGRMIGRRRFAELLNRSTVEFEKFRQEEDLAFRTVFELLTATAFMEFAKQKIDVAVIEAGLGAKLDATIVVEPIVSVMTPIGLDHMQVLGSTVEEIAADKAHIFKRGSVGISAPQSPEVMEVLQRRADLVGTTIDYAEGGSEFRVVESSPDLTSVDVVDGIACGLRLSLPLAGRFQLTNLSVALKAVEELRHQHFNVSPASIEMGVASTRWPGRFQLIGKRPVTIIDGAHNPLAIKALLTALSEILPDRKFHIVFSAIKGKPAGEMISMLAGFAEAFHLAPLHFPKGASIEALIEAASYPGIPVSAYTDVPVALRSARSHAGRKGVVLATGSLYLTGEILRARKGLPLPPMNGNIPDDI